MNTANIIAIVAAGVSFISMCAAIANAATARKNSATARKSASIAEEAKEQALKAATLEPRTRAINHIHQAHFDVTNTGYVTGETVNSIHEARKIAARVFSRQIRTELDRAHATASNKLGANQHSPENIELGNDLQTLITRMNEEAALGG